ncbi:MAG: Fe-S cluster assembly protein SufD [Bacteroidales bacterium]|nr:Fe-S cluster assembly protein SufD [Bacteroidales bacterium]
MMENYQNLKQLFDGFFDQYINNETDSPLSLSIRKGAFEDFYRMGFPTNKIEKWRKTKLKDVLDLPYTINTSDRLRTQQQKSIFECEINNLDTDLFSLLNGWYEKSSENLLQGVIVCSIREAEQKYPELFSKYFDRMASDRSNGLIALNSAIYSDGYFVYVPDNVACNRTIQIVNVINATSRIFVNTRNLVIVGKNASLSLVHCDDSLSSFGSFVNNVSEFFVDEGGQLDFYKMQNKDEKATVITHNFVEQQRDTNTHANTITFNGGLIRNDTRVKLAGKGSHADVMGLYLVDREQFVDNQVKIDHAVSDCTSNQLFKGIVDENGRAIFNGHILVQQDAQRTAAYQSNNNIQLTDTASIDTHPFLEIYADDVKCSHGATVGQLDEDALFYMMQRGICERNARMLLMFSFAGQVIDHIKIPAIKNRISELVSRRLKGELSACESCELNCENPDSVMTFEIDMSKI